MENKQNPKNPEEILAVKLDKIITVLERIAAALESEQEIDENSDDDMNSQETPKELSSSSPEELARKLVDFAKKENGSIVDSYGALHLNLFDVNEFFWNQMKVKKFSLPSEMQLKMKKVEMLAQQELIRKHEAKDAAEKNKEKEKLPELIPLCVDWAKSKGLKKITLLDVDAFLMEKSLSLSSEFRRLLYISSNSKLKYD